MREKARKGRERESEGERERDRERRTRQGQEGELEEKGDEEKIMAGEKRKEEKRKQE